MRVLMLGWEFPPFIAGGLGTACYGLTRALNSLGTDVLFVLPRPIHAAQSSAVTLAGPRYEHPESHRPPKDRAPVEHQSDATWHTNGTGLATMEAGTEGAGGGGGGGGGPHSVFTPINVSAPETYRLQEFPHVTFRTVDALLMSPYATPQQYQRVIQEQRSIVTRQPLPASAAPTTGSLSARMRESWHPASAQWATRAPNAPPQPAVFDGPPLVPVTTHSVVAPSAVNYAGDLLTETQRYADLAAAIAREQSFDVIHAHDWMTFRAGMAAAEASGKPLIVHVHSTEYDRSGQSLDAQVVAIERAGCLAADTVIAVSQLTKRLLVARYGIPADKITVVHNAIDLPGKSDKESKAAGAGTIRKDEKIVLFLGRITAQKGPEYFLAAARKVLNVYDKVKFIVAGSGDLITQTIELAAAMGIGHKVLFTGFLQSRDVERVFRMADLFVMTSVSEPFGIAPLEALGHNVPVIISKQSGVAEVLEHALKVDFWDTDELANKILAVLRRPALSKTLRKNARAEIKKMSWKDAAQKVLDIYEDLLEQEAETPPQSQTPQRVGGH